MWTSAHIERHLNWLRPRLMSSIGPGVAPRVIRKLARQHRHLRRKDQPVSPVGHQETPVRIVWRENRTTLTVEFLQGSPPGNRDRALHRTWSTLFILTHTRHQYGTIRRISPAERDWKQANATREPGTRRPGPLSNPMAFCHHHPLFTGRVRRPLPVT